MDLLRSYESLTASSSRSEVGNALRSIVNGECLREPSRVPFFAYVFSHLLYGPRIPGSLFLPASDRDRLVVLLLQDVEASLDRSDKKARLTRKGESCYISQSLASNLISHLDAGLALLALKTLGRAAAASQIISKEPVRFPFRPLAQNVL